MKILLAILLSLGLFVGGIAEETVPVVNKVQNVAGVKMAEIKQTLSGLDKEVPIGTLIKVKVSPLSAPANSVITAIYNYALLENGKLSNNIEILTGSERTGDPARTGSDMIFAVKDNTTKYQVIFSVNYIETKVGTSEIISVQKAPIQIYDIKVSGYVPPVPGPDVIPDGNFGLIRSVYLESIKLTLDKDKKIKLFTNLSNAFSGMSSKIAAGVYKDDNDDANQVKRVEDFLKETKALVNQAITDSGVELKVLDGNVDVVVKSALEKAYETGKMRKFADYQAAWAEIAEGYRLALKSQQ